MQAVHVLASDDRLLEKRSRLRDRRSEDNRRGFLRLVKPEPNAPRNQLRGEGVKEQRMIQVRYYKGLGVIDGGKELLPDKRKTHGLVKTPSNLSRRNKG